MEKIAKEFLEGKNRVRYERKKEKELLLQEERRRKEEESIQEVKRSFLNAVAVLYYFHPQMLKGKHIGCACTLTSHDDTVEALVTDDRHLYSASWDNTIKVQFFNSFQQGPSHFESALSALECYHTGTGECAHPHL